MKALQHMHPSSINSRPAEILEMGQLVLEMLRRSKDAYIQRDTKLAQNVALMDNEVDKLYARAFTEIMYRMAGASNPDEVESEYELLRIAREFERFGDLVTNVAERLIFLVTGTMQEINVDDPTGRLSFSHLRRGDAYSYPLSGFAGVGYNGATIGLLYFRKDGAPWQTQPPTPNRRVCRHPL